MKKMLFTMFFLSSLLSVSSALGFGGCETDCQKCHTLSKEEAKQVFAKLQAPDIEVIEVKMSPIGGLWEVIFENQGQRGMTYISFSKKYVMGGQIFEVDTASNKSQARLQKMAEETPKYVDLSAVPLDNALLMGDKEARHKVVVFTDPDCPFCGKLHAELKKVLAETKEIAFYMKLIALPMHPDARWKSQTIVCKNSLALLEDNFEGKPVPKPECETKVIDENSSLAEKLGITGTPTLIMPDGRVVVGGRDAKTIIDMVKNPPKKEK